MGRLLEEVTADLARGMLDDLSAVRYPSNVAAQIINGRIFPDGSCGRRDGSIRLHPSALGLVGYGGIEFTTAAGVAQLIAIVDDAFWVSTDGGVTWVDNTGANTLDEAYYDFATMRVGATNYLFAANGAANIWRWDGTTLDATPNAPSDVTYLAVFHGRLYAAKHTSPIIQASKIANPAIWAAPDGITVQIITHDGNDLTGLYQVGPHLLVFDHHATSYIDGFGEQTLVTVSGAEGFSRSVGCSGFRTIRGVGENQVCWLSERGIEYYSAGGGLQLLSRGVQNFLQGMNRAAIHESEAHGLPCAAYDPISQEYHLAIPTAGAQNARTVVVNLLQKGNGWLGAPTIDRRGTDDVDDILFSIDADGYLQEDVNGFALRQDSRGYASLDTEAAGGDPTVEDAQGYLDTVTDDTVPATLFMAADDIRGTALHSIGYDGFVRKHFGQDLDDVLSDGTGGRAVELDIISRPFLLGRPKQRKRVRTIHVSAIANESSDIAVSVRASGVSTTPKTVTIPGTTLNQPTRKRAMVKADGDAPQVEVTSTDAVRIALIGVGCDLLRESV